MTRRLQPRAGWRTAGPVRAGVHRREGHAHLLLPLLPLLLALLVLVAAARAGWVSAAVRAGSVHAGEQVAETLRDVAYVEDPHPEQRLDFTWPGDVSTATVLFIHGGSLWESGERRSSPMYRGVCDAFVSRGVACASIDYRLAPSFQWPAMPRDGAAAVAKVRDLVRSRGGDPERLFLFGHSSGCHLAAVVATNPAYLEEVGLVPSSLAGVVPMGCTLDRYDAALREATADDIREPFSDDRSEVERYGTAENWIAANPAHHLGPHVPPTLRAILAFIADPAAVGGSR